MAMLNNQMVLHSLNFQQFRQVKTHHFPRLAKLGLFFTFFWQISGWDRFGSVRFRFPGTGEFPVPGSVRFGSSGYNLKNGSVRFGFRFLTGLVSGS